VEGGDRVVASISTSIVAPRRRHEEEGQPPRSIVSGSTDSHHTLQQLGMRQRSRISCVSAIFQPKPDAASPFIATCFAWRRPNHKSLVLDRSFTSSVTTLGVVGSSRPSSATPLLQSDTNADQDDRWHAAYLESLMKKAGELSVKGMYFSILVIPLPLKYLLCSYDHRLQWKRESGERHLSEDGPVQATRCRCELSPTPFPISTAC
jgi:hypothetical protein